MTLRQFVIYFSTKDPRRKLANFHKDSAQNLIHTHADHLFINHPNSRRSELQIRNTPLFYVFFCFSNGIHLVKTKTHKKQSEVCNELRPNQEPSSRAARFEAPVGSNRQNRKLNSCLYWTPQKKRNSQSPVVRTMYRGQETDRTNVPI